MLLKCNAKRASSSQVYFLSPPKYFVPVGQCWFCNVPSFGPHLVPHKFCSIPFVSQHGAQGFHAAREELAVACHTKNLLVLQSRPSHPLGTRYHTTREKERITNIKATITRPENESENLQIQYVEDFLIQFLWIREREKKSPIQIGAI